MSEWLLNPEEIARQYSASRIFAFFSGGDDSLVATHFGMEHGAHEVIHINTGTGIKQNREFVLETVQAYGWPFRELHPPDWTYRDMVLRKGFPGPAGHRYAYSWLKERAIAKLVRETKRSRHDRVILLTGVRRKESARRMGYVQAVLRLGARVWLAPAFEFSKLDIADYKRIHNLPTNPVAKVLGRSGECNCGAFAQQPPSRELVKIQQFDPELHAEIMRLQQDAKEAGKHWKWGMRPPKAKDLNQHDIPFMPLCAGCPHFQGGAA